MTYPTLIAVLLIAFSLPQSGTAQEIDSPMKLVANMTKYHVGVLWKGPNWDEKSPVKIEARIRESSQSWRSAIADGKLVGAVRVAEPVDLWGLLFFKTESIDEMETITEGAVSVKEGLLKGQVINVWGTRGLGSGLAQQLTDDPESDLDQEEFYMVIYRKGENWSDKADAPETREATSEGIQYLFDLYKSGDLRFSCALEDYSLPARGMAILQAANLEEAAELASSHPMVRKNWLTAEVTPVHIVGGILP